MLDKGYRSVVGSLLWMGGRTGPDLCGLITMLCKVMARPSMLAWKAAMQCLAFCYQNKMTLGIRFRSDGNRHRQAAYDMVAPRMMMGASATLVGGVVFGADRRCGRPTAGGVRVGAVVVSYLLF
eukprot:SAG11_NODE_6782_length_1249_cov_10.497391_1_plen_124_part_00